MTHKTAHTPGPWHVGMAPGPIVYGADSSQVADLRGDLLPRPETIANLRLICAAPALLEALEEAEHILRNILTDSQLDARLDCGKTVRQFYVDARRAIAAARGEG